MSINTSIPSARPNTKAISVLVMVLLVASGLVVSDVQMAIMFAIALAMGIALYHASFGFSTAYRQLFTGGDTKGAQSHLVLLGITTLLFAPFLASGSAFGTPVGGAIAPVGMGMAFGAFLFGIGMQLANACASGTLYTAGGGSPRMFVVLICFCAGAFWGSLDLFWWQSLPGIRAISFGQEFGWLEAITGQLIVLFLIFLLLKKLDQKRPKIGRSTNVAFSFGQILRGPWPLVWGAGALAPLNGATLVTAGHPWSITWGFTLWAGKAATQLGWDPASSSFWASGFQADALKNSIWSDVTSVMNIGILAGAALASVSAKRIGKSTPKNGRAILAAVIGGLMLGYGARLAYGCNIGAFVSGVASTSLHGWIWIICALPGNWIGIKLRPYFNLLN
ncbi:MAG: YeeE/YedE family protein [Sneathiella sp.]|nr:YeeE/YedE family protein [Sneathiella sp.]